MAQGEAKRRAELYSALAEGKTIQVKNPNGTWEDVKIEGLNEIYDYNNYRIKPESKYRPFKNKEECWQEMMKHKPFGWIVNVFYKNYSHIDYVYNCDPENSYGVRLQQDVRNSNFEHIFKNYKFADGTPFGIKEE